MQFENEAQCLAAIRRSINSMNSVPDEMKRLLSDYASVFAEPVAAPPS